MASYRSHFSRFLGSRPDRLHAAAHSHHPWPDVSYAAHRQAWLDAAELQDAKWGKVFSEVLPEARSHVARRLGLPDPSSVVFAQSTHELVVRVLSCLPAPRRILTTDAEFHSFARQLRRLEEEGVAVVERVPARPLHTFDERLAAAAARGGQDLVFFSQVHFDSGYAMADVAPVVAAVPDGDTLVVVDGYHGFMALPTDLSAVAERAFYVAGGYKYAMAGEGACFLHCPPGYGARPLNTGWFAEFGDLEEGIRLDVPFPRDGMRFAGSTFDPSGVYRFNAVQRWLDDIGLDVDGIHGHVRALQERLLAAEVLPQPDVARGGHFLSVALPHAADVERALAARQVVADRRGEHLRIGLGVYHDPDDIDDLAGRIRDALQS